MQTQKIRATYPQSSSPFASQGQERQAARRWYYLDWLRVLALLAVFLFHSTKIFSYGDFFIKNQQWDWGMELFDYIVGLWVMPLFFVLAAVAIFFSLASRDNRHFLAERCKRLLIPLLLGIFLLSPGPVYIERLTQGQFSGSFWQFLPHYFEGWYAFGGNFAWMGLHLWFLLLLLLLSPLMLPLFRYLKQASRTSVALQKLPFLQEETFLVVAVACTGIIEALVNLQPDGLGRRDFGGWSPLTYLLGFFLFGYLLALNPQALGSFERNRGRTLLLGLCTTLMYLILALGYGSSTYSIPFSFLRVLTVWLWLATLLGFAKRYLNGNTPLLAWANQGVLPFYILHVPVLVIVAFFLVPWNIPVLAKCLLITLVSFAIIIGVYQGVIRPLPALRFIFGMKASEKRTRVTG